MTQGWVDADRKCGLDPEVFGAVAVELLDAAFGVAAVRAHVPLARCAVAAGRRIGPADDPDRQVTGGEAGAGRRLLGLPDRLMPEEQPRSEERRVGTAGVRTCRSRGSPDN